MNAQEHKLVIGMLATQLAMVSELYVTLKEKGVLQQADIRTIENAALSGAPQAVFLPQVSQLYQQMASSLGLKLDLGDFPPKASR